MMRNPRSNQIPHPPAKCQLGNCSDNDNNDNANQDKRKAKQLGPSCSKSR